MKHATLSRDKAGLLIIDVQEKLFPYMDRSCDVLSTMQKAIKGISILKLPIVISEQYPKGLGFTIGPIKHCFPNDYPIWTKTAFSCLGDLSLKEHLLSLSVQQWILIGIEAHVCVLQTAKDLLSAQKEVVILNDAITSRSIYDFSTAIAELRDEGARITSTETVLFELLKDSQAQEFKQISQLVK